MGMKYSANCNTYHFKQEEVEDKIQFDHWFIRLEIEIGFNVNIIPDIIAALMSPQFLYDVQYTQNRGYRDYKVMRVWIPVSSITKNFGIQAHAQPAERCYSVAEAINNTEKISLQICSAKETRSRPAEVSEESKEIGLYRRLPIHLSNEIRRSYAIYSGFDRSI